MTTVSCVRTVVCHRRHHSRCTFLVQRGEKGRGGKKRISRKRGKRSCVGSALISYAEGDAALAEHHSFLFQALLHTTYVVGRKDAFLAIGQKSAPPVWVHLLRRKDEQLNTTLKRELVRVAGLIREPRPCPTQARRGAEGGGRWGACQHVACKESRQGRQNLQDNPAEDPSSA